MRTFLCRTPLISLLLLMTSTHRGHAASHADSGPWFRTVPLALPIQLYSVNPNNDSHYVSLTYQLYRTTELYRASDAASKFNTHNENTRNPCIIQHPVFDHYGHSAPPEISSLTYWPGCIFNQANDDPTGGDDTSYLPSYVEPTTWQEGCTHYHHTTTTSGMPVWSEYTGPEQRCNYGEDIVVVDIAAILRQFSYFYGLQHETR